MTYGYQQPDYPSDNAAKEPEPAGRDESRDVWVGWLTLETLFERAATNPRGAATTARGIVATIALGETGEDAMAMRYSPTSQLERVQTERDSWRRVSERLQEEKNQIADERERHAALQSRCYEGFASASDGIFDALRETDRELDQTRKALGELVKKFDAWKDSCTAGKPVRAQSNLEELELQFYSARALLGKP